jgi:hypothetical protein
MSNDLNISESIIQAEINEKSEERAVLKRRRQEIEDKIQALDIEIDALNGAIQALNKVTGNRYSAPKSVEPSTNKKSWSASPELRAEFRDWVVNDTGRHERGFSRQDVMDQLNTSVDVARELIDMALVKKPPLIEETNIKRRNPGATMGKYPMIYRYVQEVADHKHVNGSNGTATPVRSGGPVATANKTKARLPKDTAKVIQPALSAGATLVALPGGHFRLMQEGKEPVTISGTPSDNRSLKNLKAQLKRNRYAIS